MKGDKPEGGGRNGSNNYDQGCVQDSDGQKEVFEFTILIIDRLDSWIITVLQYIVSDKNRGRKRG